MDERMTIISTSDARMSAMTNIARLTEDINVPYIS